MPTQLNASPTCGLPGTSIALTGTSNYVGGEPARFDTILIVEIDPTSANLPKRVITKAPTDAFGIFAAYITLPKHGRYLIRALSTRTGDFSPILILCPEQDGAFGVGNLPPEQSEALGIGIIGSLIAGVIIYLAFKKEKG